MESKIEELILEYKSTKYLLYSKFLDKNSWGNEEAARKYLEQYFLSDEEYVNDWKPIQNEIFINQDKSLPEKLFGNQYELKFFVGGVIFEKDDFEALMKCMRSLNQDHFVIIQNNFGDIKPGIPSLNFKFPSTISWEELLGGNFIFSVLFEMFHNEYYVFGTDSSWGKYSANEYQNPLDIIGFKKKKKPIFDKYFSISEEKKDEILEWIPSSYK